MENHSEHNTPNQGSPQEERGNRTIASYFENMPKVTAFFKSLDFVKKYVFDFFVIFISISASAGVAEWQRQNIHRHETVLALKAVKEDLMIDTTNFNKIIPTLERLEPVLLDAMNGEVDTNNVEELRLILEGLRAYHGRGVQKYGYHYLSNNIRNPKINSKRLLHFIGIYHELASPEGNFGGFNHDYYEIAFENHQRLFEIFPLYLHPDSTVANQAIVRGASTFLEDPYWRARISLTYRQIVNYNLPVYNNMKNFATKVIAMIERETENE